MTLLISIHVSVAGLEQGGRPVGVEGATHDFYGVNGSFAAVSAVQLKWVSFLCTAQLPAAADAKQAK